MDGGGYILAGGGWWWIYFGWWWVVVYGCWWLWVFVDGGIVSSNPFFKMGVVKNFAIFAGKHLRRSLFLTTLQAFFRERIRWLLLLF